MELLVWPWIGLVAVVAGYLACRLSASGKAAAVGLAAPGSAYFLGWLSC